MERELRKARCAEEGVGEGLQIGSLICRFVQTHCHEVYGLPAPSAGDEVKSSSMANIERRIKKLDQEQEELELGGAGTVFDSHNSHNEREKALRNDSCSSSGAGGSKGSNVAAVLSVVALLVRKLREAECPHTKPASSCAEQRQDNGDYEGEDDDSETYNRRNEVDGYPAAPAMESAMSHNYREWDLQFSHVLLFCLFREHPSISWRRLLLDLMRRDLMETSPFDGSAGPVRTLHMRCLGLQDTVADMVDGITGSKSTAAPTAVSAEEKNGSSFSFSSSSRSESESGKQATNGDKTSSALLRALEQRTRVRGALGDNSKSINNIDKFANPWDNAGGAGSTSATYSDIDQASFGFGYDSNDRNSFEYERNEFFSISGGNKGGKGNNSDILRGVAKGAKVAAGPLSSYENASALLLGEVAMGGWGLMHFVAATPLRVEDDEEAWADGEEKGEKGEKIEGQEKEKDKSKGNGRDRGTLNDSTSSASSRKKNTKNANTGQVDSTAIGKIVEVLMSFGVRAGEADFEKRTPLHVACAVMHLDMISYLLSHAGASVRARDSRGATALDTLLKTMSLCDWAGRAHAGGWDSYTVANTVMALTGNDSARLWDLRGITAPASDDTSGLSGRSMGQCSVLSYSTTATTTTTTATELLAACEQNALSMAVRLGDSLVLKTVISASKLAPVKQWSLPVIQYLVLWAIKGGRAWVLEHLWTAYAQVLDDPSPHDDTVGLEEARFHGGHQQWVIFFQTCLAAAAVSGGYKESKDSRGLLSSDRSSRLHAHSNVVNSHASPFKRRSNSSSNNNNKSKSKNGGNRNSQRNETYGVHDAASAAMLDFLFRRCQNVQWMVRNQGTAGVAAGAGVFSLPLPLPLPLHTNMNNMNMTNAMSMSSQLNNNNNNNNNKSVEAQTSSMLMLSRFDVAGSSTWVPFLHLAILRCCVREVDSGEKQKQTHTHGNMNMNTSYAQTQRGREREHLSNVPTVLSALLESENVTPSHVLKPMLLNKAIDIDTSNLSMSTSISDLASHARAPGRWLPLLQRSDVRMGFSLLPPLSLSCFLPHDKNNTLQQLLSFLLVQQQGVPLSPAQCGKMQVSPLVACALAGNTSGLKSLQVGPV